MKLGHHPEADRDECESELRDSLDLNGGAIRKHFGYALHHFGGVVAHTDDGVGSMFSGVLEEQFVGVFTSFLAKVRKNGDVTANNRLQGGTEIADDAARPDDDAADNSELRTMR